MKVLHVALDVNPVNGGPPRSIAGLCKAEAAAGLDVALFIHDPTGCEFANLGGCKLIRGTGRYREGHWREDIARTLDLVRPDIVHQHAMWDLPLHVDDVECRKRDIPYIVAPRGSLEPWSLEQGKWKKRIARWLYQDRDLHRAVALHATADSEAKQFRRLGFVNRVIVSPNGVSVPDFDLTQRRRDVGSRHRALFVSRMHPKKGVMELVEALRLCDSALKTWEVELVYTVNGDFEREYESMVRTRVKELGLEDKFVFTGALSDAEKWNAYARADLFVLPTYSENFGIAVAEALFAGAPVITTKGAPWVGLEEHQCGWWIDIGIEPLTKALTKAMALDDAARREMGARGREWMKRDFDWNAIGRKMKAAYEWLLNGGDKPEWVRY